MVDHGDRFSFTKSLIFFLKPKHDRNLGSVYNREEEGEHDTVEGDAHTIISCIIFSMSCVLLLLVIVFTYDVVKYTKFGRNYLQCLGKTRLYEGQKRQIVNNKHIINPHDLVKPCIKQQSMATINDSKFDAPVIQVTNEEGKSIKPKK